MIRISGPTLIVLRHDNSENRRVNIIIINPAYPYDVTNSRAADPVKVDPDPNPTFKKKMIRVRIQPSRLTGSDSQKIHEIDPLLFFFDIKVLREKNWIRIRLARKVRIRIRPLKGSWIRNPG